MTLTQSQSTVTHATFVIERAYPVSPERVFDAFSDPVKKLQWFGDVHDAQGQHHEMDFRVGGKERTVRRLGDDTPFPGTIITNDTVYQDIVPNKRIVFAYTMSFGDRPMSASLATVELLPDGTGTNLIFTEQAAHFEGSDGPERRERGWRSHFEKMASVLAH